MASDNGSSGAPLLSVKNLSYEYGRLLALDDISFDIAAGDLVALVGRNGAGKSTLLRCLAGWTQVARGEIWIGGLALRQNERAIRRLLALVPDTPPFYDDLTAWEHLQLVAGSHRLGRWAPQGEALLDAFGLWSARGSYPFTFSRGMRYKLGLCLALLLDPKLLLLDEPLGPLDPVSAAYLWGELERRRNGSEGMAILLSSHQLPAGAHPDRYLVLDQGQLIAAGTPAGLASSLHIAGFMGLDQLLDRAIETANEQADE